MTTAALALACERFGDTWGGWLGQPANTVTSVAFVAAAVAVLASRRGASRVPGGVYAALVAAVGLGSVVQHGPHPPWQAYAHDLPLAAVLAFVAADSAADLTGRRALAWAWLPVPVLMVPLVSAGPGVSTAAQAALGVTAVGLGLLRAWRRRRLRRPLLTALLLLGAGALAGTLGDRAGLCDPDSLWQGHALWHLLAAGALWRLAPVIGSGQRAGRPPVQRAAEGSAPAGEHHAAAEAQRGGEAGRALAD